jgi:hypothetical protein
MIKQFTAGDITVRPFSTFKHWTLQSIDSASVNTYGDSTYYNGRMEVNEGLKLSTPFYPSGSIYYVSTNEPINSSGKYARNIHSMTDAMFYKNVGEPIKLFGVEEYTQDPKTGKEEVREIHDRIITATLKHNVYGEKVIPNTVKLVDDSDIHQTLKIHDDGYTNLYATGSHFPSTAEIQAIRDTHVSISQWDTGSGLFYVTFSNGSTQYVNYINAKQYMAMGLQVTYVPPVSSGSEWVLNTGSHQDLFFPENEHFGESVSCWSKYVAVGSSMDAYSLSDARIGHAALFKYDETRGHHRPIAKIHFPFTQSLTDTSSYFKDSFGTSVCVRDNFLAVGSPTGSVCSSSMYPGFVCVYDRYKGGEDNWGIINILKGKSNGDRFGASVAIDNDILAVGATGVSGSKGAVYLYRKKRYMDAEYPCQSINTGSVWMQVVTQEDFCKELQTGSYIASQSYTPTFVSGNYSWVYETTITPSNQSVGDNFGWCVSLDSNRLVVGTNKPGKGYAAVFTCSYHSASLSACPTASWSQNQLFTATSGYGDLNIDAPEYSVDASDTIVSDMFGYSVDISGKNLIIGCKADKGFKPYYGYTGNAMILGAAYLYTYRYDEACLAWQYDLLTKTFGNREYLTNNNFGHAVSIDGTTAAVTSLPDTLGRTVVYSSGSYILENYAYESSASLDSVLGRVTLYNFDFTNDNWYRAGELRRNKEENHPYNIYGYSVSIASDFMCVGAPIVNLAPSIRSYSYTVDSVLYYGDYYMDIWYSGSNGNTNHFVTQSVSPFTYSFCAWSGSIMAGGDWQNLVVGSVCNDALDPINQSGSFSSSYSGSVFVYDMNKYEVDPKIGNVFYKNGHLAITNTSSMYHDVMTGTGSRGFTLDYQGAHTIYEHEYLVSIRPGEFNYSTNPTSLQPNPLTFDVNQDGVFDYKDVDLIMRYLKLKKFYADYVLDDNGIVLEQDTNTDFSWWANDILQTESEDVLQQEDDTASSIKYSYLSAFNNTAYMFITNNLYDTGLLDIDGDGKINMNDGYILALYVLKRLNPSTLAQYLTSDSTRRYVKDIEDYLNPYCGNNPFRVNPEFIGYQYSSSYDATGSFLSPCVTTIGLYQDNQLVAVGKLGRPIKNLIDWPVNIIVRFDT